MAARRVACRRIPVPLDIARAAGTARSRLRRGGDDGRTQRCTATDPRRARHRDELQGLGARGRAADAAQQPRPRGRRAPRRARGLRRDRQGRAGLALAARDRVVPSGARGRRDAARAVRATRRGRADPRVGAEGPHREREPRPGVGDVGGVPAPRAPRPHHVRPDDGWIVDLHRDPGHPPGHLRDLRRHRRAAIRRLAVGHAHGHVRRGRDGRCPGAGGHDERRRRARGRRRPEPHRAAAALELSRHARALARRGALAPRGGALGGQGAVGRPRRERRRAAPRARPPRRAHRRRHGPDARP